MIDMNNYYDDKGTYIFREEEYPVKQMKAEYESAEAARKALIKGIQDALKVRQKEDFDYVTYGFKNSIASVALRLPEAEREKALQLLPAEIADDVRKRITDMEEHGHNLQVIYPVPEDMIDTIDIIDVSDLKRLVHSVTGNLTSAEIRAILDEQIVYDPDFKEELEDAIFLFEDVVYLDDRAIQIILREIDNTELANALCGIDEEVLQKFLRNMSDRAGRMLVVDIQMIGRQHQDVVLWSRNAILSKIIRLEECGEIVIPHKNDMPLV